MKTLFVLLCLLASLPAWAAPTTWQAKSGTGQIEFTAWWNGTPVKGHFPAFTLKATLDADQPAGGAITLHIDTRKLKAQSADITRAIRANAWFDVKHHPEAGFDSASLSTLPNGTLVLRGTLRIKDHEKTVSFPIELDQTDHALTLSGRVRLDRSDFAIGTGQWAGGSVIAHKVDVHFNFVLVPAG